MPLTLYFIEFEIGKIFTILKTVVKTNSFFYSFVPILCDFDYIMLKPARTLSVEEFQHTVANLRLSEENVVLAKKVMVQGMPINVLAKEVNHKSKQVLDKVIKRIWDRFLELQGTPTGWLSIRVDLPFDEAIKIKKKEKELKEELIKKIVLEK